MYAKPIVLQKQGIPNCYVAHFGDLHSRVTIMISNSFFCYNIILFKPNTFIEPYKCCTLQWKLNMTINAVNIYNIHIFKYMCICRLTCHMYIFDVVYTI